MLALNPTVSERRLAEQHALVRQIDLKGPNDEKNIPPLLPDSSCARGMAFGSLTAS